MEKVQAIEISSKAIKIVVGFVQDNKVHVLYALRKPIPQCYEGKHLSGENFTKLVKEIENVSHVEDETSRIKFDLSNVVLAVPPYDFNLISFKNLNAITNTDAIISEKDIIAAITAARNAAKKEGLYPVDIIPRIFTMDDGSTHLKAPIGKSSTSLDVESDVHLMPADVVNAFKNPLTSANLNVNKLVVAPFGTIELLSTYPNMPSEYFLVDIGSNTTTVSLVGGHQLSDSRIFNWGGDNITEKIITSWNIKEADAEKYKKTYGLDTRNYTFKAPICTVEDNEGHTIKHYGDELNTIIKNELDIFVNELRNACSSLLGEEYKSYLSSPMILIGGGSKLLGLKEYIEHKVESDTLTIINPTSIGARDSTYFNCLGLIYAYTKYPPVTDEYHASIGGLTRNK